VWVQFGNGGPLPEDGWELPSSSNNPAGQERGAQGETIPNAFQPTEEEEDNILIRSLPQTEISDGILQHSHPHAEASRLSTPMENTDGALRCDDCGLTFPKRHLLNTHRKRHDRPFKCTASQCDRAFQYKKDLERHRHAKHSETVPGIALLYCPHPGCKYSFERGTGSSRKDNLKRHIRTQHGGRSAGP